MSQHDAELFYDRIPRGAVDPKAPDRFLIAAHAVRSGQIKLKPEAIIARMAKQIAVLATSRGVTVEDLKRLGNSEHEIALYGNDALAAAMLANPTLDGLEFAA